MVIVNTWRAFTLIELLLVLAIIGVVAGALALSVNLAQTENSVRRAAEEIEVFTQTLMSKAAVSRAPVRLTLAPGKQQVTAQIIGLEAEQQVHQKDLPGGVRIAAVRLQQKTLMQRPAEVVVQPSGYLPKVALLLQQQQQRIWMRWHPQTDRWTQQRVSASEG